MEENNTGINEVDERRSGAKRTYYQRKRLATSEDEIEIGTKRSRNPDSEETTESLSLVDIQNGMVKKTEIEKADSTDDAIQTAAESSVPNVKVITINNDSRDPVTQSWFTTKQDKNYLTEKGLQWRQGMWSKEEVAILEANISQYVQDNNLSDAAEVIFEMSKDERKEFYRTIAKGIHRPLFAIYRRVLRMYDKKNHIGKYSQEEMEKLKMLRTKFGTDWQSIGMAMGRSAASVKDKCRLMKDTCLSGKWKKEEEEQLKMAVHQLSKTNPGEKVTGGISWSAVANLVKTRSEKQCRAKWLNYLNWKELGGVEWTKDDEITLIDKIRMSNYQDESNINWGELASNWPSVRSPQWLRNKWWNLKRHVEAADNISFTELLECMQGQLVHTSMRPIYHGHQQQPTTSLQQPHPHHGNVRVLKIDSVPGIVQVPVPLPQHGGTTITTTTVTTAADDGLESSDLSSAGGEGFQAFEVLQSTMTLPTTTFLITNSAGDGVIPTSSGDQIIIRAVTSEAVRDNGNVAVEMNNSAGIIINTDQSHRDDVGSPLSDDSQLDDQIDDNMGQALEANHTYRSDITDSINHENMDGQHDGMSTGEIDQSDLTGNGIGQSGLVEQDSLDPENMSDHMLGQPHATFDTDMKLPSLDGDVEHPTLVIVSADEPQLHVSTNNVFTLTGPILQSQQDEDDSDNEK